MMPPSTTGSNDEVERQAAAWVLRQDRTLTGAEQDEFLQWLAQDPRHGAALTRHRRNWDRLNLLAQWRPEHGPRPNRDLLAPVVPLNRRPVLRWFVAAGTLAAAAALAWGLLLRPPAPSAEPVSNLPVATIEQRTLEDGSTVDLNRGAQVAVMYTAGERRVCLERGEAHFTVAKDPARPFIVSAGGVDVRAVGTAFNVRLSAAAVEVLVTAGRVQVTEQESAVASAPPVILDARQGTTVSRARVDPAPQIASLSERELAERLAWQPRLIDFTATPLQGIVDEFNRRNAPYRLVIVDPDLARIQVSASLRSDNVEGFVRLLEAGFGVRTERDGTEIHLHRP